MQNTIIIINIGKSDKPVIEYKASTNKKFVADNNNKVK